MWLLFTIIIALLYSSLVEYLLHRFFLHHDNEQKHIQNHHKKFHGILSYEDNLAEFWDIVSSKKYVILNVLLGLPITFLIFIQNTSLSALYITVSFVYAIWVEYLHLYYHRTDNSFINKFKFFHRLKEHHRVHHYQYNTNYGLATAIWDILLKTKK